MTKRRSNKAAKRSREMKMLAGIGAVTLAVLAIAAIAFNRSGSDEEASVPLPNDQLVTADSYKITSPDAKVTVVEFLDMECEACAAAHPIVKQILNEYEGRINYVVRNFPNHNNSLLAAKAAEAAGEQGKYFEMTDKLFTGQRAWGEREDPQTEVFIGYARELGLDVDRFTASLASDDYVAKITTDKQQAISLGVDATPTFFINGKKYVGVMSVDTFGKNIDAAMQAAN